MSCTGCTYGGDRGTVSSGFLHTMGAARYQSSHIWCCSSTSFANGRPNSAVSSESERGVGSQTNRTTALSVARTAVSTGATVTRADRGSTTSVPDGISRNVGCHQGTTTVSSPRSWDRRPSAKLTTFWSTTVR